MWINHNANNGNIELRFLPKKTPPKLLNLSECIFPVFIYFCSGLVLII